MGTTRRYVLRFELDRAGMAYEKEMNETWLAAGKPLAALPEEFRKRAEDAKRKGGEPDGD